MNKYPFHWPTLMLAALTFPLCSCKEHWQLFQELAQLKEKLRRVQLETQETDAKFTTLGQPSVYVAQQLENQVAEEEKAMAKQRLEVAELDSKVSALDQALENFRPKVDAYKAAYLK
jgi:seryl-tRNA synthetase